MKIYQDKAKRYSARKDVGNIWLSREASYRGYCAGYRAAIRDAISEMSGGNLKHESRPRLEGLLKT